MGESARWRELAAAAAAEEAAQNDEVRRGDGAAAAAAAASDFDEADANGDPDVGQPGPAPLPRVGEPSGPPRDFTPIVLEKLDECLFRGPKKDLWRPLGQKGIYGGQVLSQCLSACLQSVDSRKELHSMHSYFLQAGKETADIIYTVTRLRDGKSFATRMVTGSQGGVAIFVLIASFQTPRVSSLVAQDPMPAVPNPDLLMTDQRYLLSLTEDPRCPEAYRQLFKARSKQKGLIDVRRVLTRNPFDGIPFPEGSDYEPPPFPEFTNEPRQIFWMRTNRVLSDDPNVHRAVLAYASDINLLGTALGTTPLHEISMVASLDHSMYFHKSEFRMDEWMLYVMNSPRVEGERGLAFGKIFRRDGTLVVTVTQEGLIRLNRDYEQTRSAL